MDFLVAGGQRLECRRIPSRLPHLPALVFLHEALGSAAQWRDFPDQLAERTGAGALIYSRAGHGRSESLQVSSGAGHLMNEATVVLPAVLAAAGIERPVLVGHSDGGTIALMFAASTGGAAGLVVEAAHVFVEDVTVAGVTHARAAYSGGGLRDKLARWHDHVDPMFARWTDTWLDPTFRGWSMEPALESVSCPVLIIQGEPDPYGTMAQVDAIQRGVSGPARTLVLPGGGHAPHATKAEEVLDAAAAFIAALPKGGA